MRVVNWLSLAVASIVLASVAAPAALSQSDYPNRPIRLIVGFIPGSAAEITARVLANAWGKFSASS